MTSGVDGLSPVRERAIRATDVSVTISDPTQPGNPLVWVNAAFCRLTGHSYAESVGRNCNFLQGPETDLPTVLEMAADMGARRSHRSTLLNYRADGSMFYNQVSISPVYDEASQLSHFIGIQIDVTDRVVAEQAQDLADIREADAQSALEQAHARLVLLSGVTEATMTLDVEQALARLADVLVPALADSCDVQLAGAAAPRWPASGLGKSQAAMLAVQAQVLSSGEPQLLAGAASALVVPLSTDGHTLGVLTLTRRARRGRYTEDDLSLAVVLARRAALCMDNARRYQQEHRVAEQLQRSLLPSLPTVPGLTLAARYQVSEDAEVGGDWYDVLPLPDGATGVVVGDVMGHDLTAAAAMGQLRGILRCYAWEGRHPGSVLDGVDTLVQGLGVAELATAFYGRLERDAGSGVWRLTYGSAGHIPPLVWSSDGSVQQLSGAPGTLIGALSEQDGRPIASVELPAGSVLALFTDGLVERRDDDLDAGLARVSDVLRATGPADDLEAVADAILRLSDRSVSQDDVALLLVRLGP